MNTAKRLILLTLGALLLSGTMCGRAMAQSDKKYRQALVEMLDASHALTAAETMLEQLLPNMRQLAPEIPAEFWSKAESRFAFEHLKERLIDLYVPIYRARFSIDELRAITEFYRTPIGQKLAEATPTMTIEAMQAGEQLGMELMDELMRDLEKAMKRAARNDGRE